MVLPSHLTLHDPTVPTHVAPGGAIFLSLKCQSSSCLLSRSCSGFLKSLPSGDSSASVGAGVSIQQTRGLSFRELGDASLATRLPVRLSSSVRLDLLLPPGLEALESHLVSH